MYASIWLSDDEMRQLNATIDLENPWYGVDDTVRLGGHLPDDELPNPTFGISVNGGDTDNNWARWSELPENIQARLLAAPNPAPD
jgi:hypothetical protein